MSGFDLYFFVFLTAIDLFAGVWAVCISFTKRMGKLPRWHIFGLLVCAFGLLAQSFRNLHFLFTGISTADNEFPLWALKDIGIFIIAAHSVLLFTKKMERQNEF